MAIKQDETLPAPGDTGEDGAAGGSGTKDSGPRMSSTAITAGATTTVDSFTWVEPAS